MTMTQILEEPSYISLHSIFANMDPEVCFDFTAALDASDIDDQKFQPALSPVQETNSLPDYSPSYSPTPCNGITLDEIVNGQDIIETPLAPNDHTVCIGTLQYFLQSHDQWISTFLQGFRNEQMESNDAMRQTLDGLNNQMIGDKYDLNYILSEVGNLSRKIDWLVSWQEQKYHGEVLQRDAAHTLCDITVQQGDCSKMSDVAESNGSISDGISTGIGGESEDEIGDYRAAKRPRHF